MLRIFPIFRPVPSARRVAGARTRAAGILLSVAALTITVSLPAQTLAHRNWSGNGLTATVWWQNAVFYRLTPALFQDSNGDGVGDLPGIAQRADYLQSLGIDALILAPPDDPDAFSTLQRELSAHHIRLVIELGPDANILATARLWLSRGAAGICVSSPFRTPENDANAHLRELRALIHAFPGERVLIARPYNKGVPTQPDGADLVGQIIDAAPSLLRPIFSSIWDATRPTLPAGSKIMMQSGDMVPSVLGNDASGLGLQKFIGARLLATPGAAAFVEGQELGLIPSFSLSRQLNVMPWTPSNITPPEAAPEPASAVTHVAPADPNAYTTFKPYVPPKPQPKPLAPGAPPPPDSLPGFTTGKLLYPALADAATVNVAVEDVDPLSLLNFYRRLSQLHHDHPALRSGAEVDFDHSAEKAVVWLRRAPAGTRHATDIVVLCNLGDQPLNLSLDDDLGRLHIRAASLRPLLASWSAHPPFQYTSRITLPPHGVYLGELSR